MITYSQSVLNRFAIAIGLNVWVAGAFIAAQFAIGLALLGARLAGVDFAGINPATISLVFAFLAYFLALVLIIAVHRYRNPLTSIGKTFGIKRLISWKDIALAFVGIIPYLIIVQLLLAAAATYLPFFDQDQAQDAGFSNLSQRYEYLAAFIALVVLAPLAEEALFRGYLYSKLRKIQGIVVSTFFVSLTFAILHQQLNVGLDVFVLSIVLCVLREVTGNIWSGVLLHMMKNGLAYYILFIAPMV